MVKEPEIRDEFRLRLQAPLPEQVCASIHADKPVQPLVALVRRHLFDGQTILDYFVERQRFHGKVRERLRDRTTAYRYLVKEASYIPYIPNYKTDELVKLPAALSVLYYLVHPARLVHKIWLHTSRRRNTTP